MIQQLPRSNNSVKQIYLESKQLGQQTSNSQNLTQGRPVSYLQLCY